MATVLVPYAEGIAALSQVDDVIPLRYDPGFPLPDGAADAEILVPPFFADAGAEVAQGLPRLRLIQLLTVGYEAWVDRVPDGVALSTARGAHGGATAEWVLAVLLALRRELPAFVRAQDAGRWAPHHTGTLRGSRVLIVGAGDVAWEITRRLEPFGASATLVGRAAREGVYAADELPRLLSEHDAVVLAVPQTRDTTGLVDAEFLARMPNGGVLVNAARGPIVRTDALLAELTAGRLRAALDVTDPEPLPADHPLWQAPGLLITPHVGGSVEGSTERAFTVAAAQIAAFLAGQEPSNLVRTSRE